MTPEIEQIIMDMVRAEFPDAELQSIDVAEALDADEDPILQVTVVFETSRDIDSTKTPGLVRHIWPKLVAAKENRFPLFRLMTSADAKRLRTAAA
jgi:hypothetical protein